MHFLMHLVWIIPAISLVFAHEDDVHTIKYNTDNFSEEVSKKNHFVMFYAPWCGHCQRLGPTWEQLAEMLNEEDSNMRIAKVDCTSDSKVCSEQDVTGYPTLKFFKVGATDGIKFRGTRDLPSLTTFINEQLREGDEETNVVSEPQAVGGLVELTEDNFNKFVESGKHFIKFYAPWCGHCQKLAPTWAQLAESVEFEDEISISKIDCTQHRSVCANFDVKGYPTLLWIENGKRVDKYQGDRSLEDLKDFVAKSLAEPRQKEVHVEKVKEVVPGPVKEITGDSFTEDIKNGLTFIKFYAPWCGHCKRLAPTWASLGTKLSTKPGVTVAKVDCTLETNKQLCNDEEIEGFPMIFLYKDGEKLSEYSGSRSLDNLYDFVNQYLGHDEL